MGSFQLETEFKITDEQKQSLYHALLLNFGNDGYGFDHNDLYKRNIKKHSCVLEFIHTTDSTTNEFERYIAAKRNFDEYYNKCKQKLIF